jgi:hypothetical protein
MGKPSAPTLFDLLPASETGLDFVNLIDDESEITIYDNVYVYNGGGVAAADINNDGLTDLFFSGNQVPSKLYLNEGDFQFRDITDEAGIHDGEGWTTGVTMADVNGDGLLDIYLCKGGNKGTPNRANQLYLNQGDLRFVESAKEWGLASEATSTHAGFFDYDLDGDLDMYLLNHPEDFELIMDFYYYIFDPAVDTLNSNRLFENTGEKFIDVTEKSGIGLEKGFGLSLSIADINLDGWPDIFVANDFLSPDYLFVNNRDKTFSSRREESMEKTSLFSMGSDFADINNDGIPDLYVADMEPEGAFRRRNNDIAFPIDFYEMQPDFLKANQFSRNMLHVGNADGTFSEMGEFAGIARTDWTWSVLFGDFDNDGWKDLLVTNGTKRELNDRDYMLLKFNNENLSKVQHRHDAKQLIDSLPRSRLMNYVFRNRNGLQFDQMMESWGVDQRVNSNGAAIADLNNDGFLDLIISNTDTFSFIYRNRGGQFSDPPAFLRLKLSGSGGNRFGLGAKAFLHTGDRVQFQELSNARGFQSSSEPVIHFGMDGNQRADSLVLIWPGGRKQLFRNLQANQVIIAFEKDAILPGQGTASKEASRLLRAISFPGKTIFQHKENRFNDFKRDKLIPYQLSKEGPKMAVADVNGDGRQDFYICGASGQPGTLFLQENSGFQAVDNSFFIRDSLTEETASVFLDVDLDGDMDLYVGAGGNERCGEDELLRDHLYLNDGKGNFSPANNRLPPVFSSTASVSASDFDGDGDPDLFVGARSIPCNYGVIPRSFLLRNEGGTFRDVTDSLAPGLRYAGMLTDAVWADIDIDSDPDLIVCGDWMPVSVWRNEGGKLSAATIGSGLEKDTGWWRRLAVADMDGDGDPDLIAGNYGWNSVLKASEKEPVSLYLGDFDQNGVNDPVISFFLSGEEIPFADRDLFCKQMPDYLNRFHTYRSFAETAFGDLFTQEQLQGVIRERANNFSSCYMENLGGGRFKVVALPFEAQIAPVNAIIARDLNGDRHVDLLLAGNSNTHYYDQGDISASRGLVLEGDGKGNFRVLTPMESGLSIEGVVRDLKEIQIGETALILAGRNNLPMEVLRLSEKERAMP